MLGQATARDFAAFAASIKAIEIRGTSRCDLRSATGPPKVEDGLGARPSSSLEVDRGMTSARGHP